MFPKDGSNQQEAVLSFDCAYCCARCICGRTKNYSNYSRFSQFWHYLYDTIEKNYSFISSSCKMVSWTIKQYLDKCLLIKLKSSAV